MAHVVKQSPNGQKGKITYNTDIVNGIVKLAVNQVEGAYCAGGKGKGIKLTFDKEGIVAEIDVRVQFGYVVPALAFRIQQAVKDNIETMTNYKVAKVGVHVCDVLFDGEAAV
ncbi:MAG: Asp23/Gls24 family envelope stress response protein [Clostridia bacterium]|nr:Asp23/Gls24 family envelope stress response protein [Clostridia bacterium]